ncbi:MAG: helix-turn-helix domain-containing protein [Armatimonadota bacterium]|nr:helix-turn-helix domain-containing protein [Armatimonadota bacterium]
MPKTLEQTKHDKTPKVDVAPQVHPLILSGNELNVRAVREKLGLSQSEFARMGGFALKSISNWENAQPISPSATLMLKQIQELQVALCRNLAPDTIGAWLLQPNEYFGGLSPLQLVEQGQLGRLWGAIYRLEAGEAS